MSRWPSPVTRCTRKAGATLIELLLAVAIAVLLLTLIYSIYRTVASTAAGQEARQEGKPAVRKAMDRVVHDLNRLFASAPEDACTVTLVPPEEDGPPFSTLSFCALTLPDTAPDLRWADVHHVRYRVILSAARAPMLLREHQPLAGPDAATGTETNVLLCPVERFVVAFDDGTNWVGGWPLGEEAKIPSAARVSIRGTSRSVSLETEVLIPVGQTISGEPVSSPEVEEEGL